MTRIERVRMVMNGGIPDRIPVFRHNFLMVRGKKALPCLNFAAMRK